jgi:hypothetical protein
MGNPFRRLSVGRSRIKLELSFENELGGDSISCPVLLEVLEFQVCQEC